MTRMWEQQNKKEIEFGQNWATLTAADVSLVLNIVLEQTITTIDLLIATLVSCLPAAACHINLPEA